MMRSKYTLAVSVLLQVSLVNIIPSNVLAQSPTLNDSKPPISVQVLNQEAEANEPKGIEKYCADLIQLIAPQRLGKDYIDKLSKRLALAEQESLNNPSKLVPETAIVVAYNHLRSETGALSMESKVERLHSFRQHASELGLYQSLLTAQRNPDKCKPGEAIYLLSLLISSEGKISNSYLDFLATSEKGNNLHTTNTHSYITGSLVGFPANNLHGNSETVSAFVHYCDVAPRQLLTKDFDEIVDDFHF